MNRPLTYFFHAATVCMVIILLSLTYIQYGNSAALKNNPHNQRVLFSEYVHRRGQIDAGNELIAYSVPTNTYIRQMRVYPEKFAEAFAPITGYYSLWYGRTGLEYSYDAILSGTDKRLFGSHFLDELAGHNPRGGSVTTTVDANLQLATFRAMHHSCGNHMCRGAAVALDPQTGKILALVSTPSFDPNKLVGKASYDSRKTWSLLNNDSASPLVDRALQRTYHPGSTFEILLTIAALQQNISPYQLVDDEPYITLPDSSLTISNNESASCPTSRHSQITLAQAFVHSCNIGFVDLFTTKIAHPAASLYNVETAYSIGSPLTLPLPTVASTLSSSTTLTQQALTALGRNNGMFTPLTNALIAASIANHGTLMRPYIVDNIKHADLTILQKFTHQEDIQVFNPHIAQILTELMQTSEENTPGYHPHSYKIASKSSSIKHGDATDSSQGWYIAFADKNHTHIAVAVMIENDKISSEDTDATYSALIGRTMIENILGGE